LQVTTPPPETLLPHVSVTLTELADGNVSLVLTVNEDAPLEVAKAVDGEKPKKKTTVNPRAALRKLLKSLRTIRARAQRTKAPRAGAETAPAVSPATPPESPIAAAIQFAPEMSPLAAGMVRHNTAPIGKTSPAVEEVDADVSTKALPAEATIEAPTKVCATRRLDGLRRAASASAKAVRAALRKAVPACGRRKMPLSADAEIVMCKL
jgi:hypothetical protein